MKNSKTALSTKFQLNPRLLLLIAILALAGAPVLRAQGFGVISGTITDSTGAAIPSASVVATQSQTGTKTVVTSNVDGIFTFPSLPPTEYSIAVTANGFQKYAQTGVVLQANQSVTINVHLQIGSSTETIEVTSDAPQVDTTTGTLSQVIDTQRVNDLPLNGRNVAQLTTLVAGIVLAPSNGADEGATKTFPVAVTVSANGSRSDQTNYLLDGGNNVDEYTNVNAPFPFPDALQEFSVQTSNYNAEYGQNAGAVVNIVTKSGTSKFHGSLFEYIRNRYFNARSYFATAPDPLKRNQFGGTIGGPVKIPHLISGEHTFFFFGYQGTKVRSSTTKSAFIPTNANRTGDFSAYLDPNSPANPFPGKTTIIYDPLTNTAFPGNIIPNYAARADQAVANFEKALPSVDGNGSVNYQLPVKQDFTEYVARVDHSIGDRDRIFGHYYFNRFSNGGALNTSDLLAYASQSNIQFQSALISETHTFTSNLLNNLILNYTRETSTRGPVPGSPDVGDFGVDIYQPSSKILAGLSATGFFSIAGSPLAVFYRDNYTLGDDIHYVKGKHNLAFGIHAEQSKFNITAQTNLPGTFTFNSNTGPGTGNALASLQLGYLYNFTQGSGSYTNNRNHFYGFYAQDSWKPYSRLTINYGLRYEPFFPWNEIKHRTEVFYPAAYAAGQTSTLYPNAPKGLFFAGDPGVPEQGVRSVLTNFMPRLGFALDVFGDGKTSLRGGGGSFYDSRLAGIFNTTTASYTPFAYNVSLTNPYPGTFNHPYTGQSSQNLFPIASPVPSGTPFPNPVLVAEYDPSGNFHVPVTYDWNLTIEQEFAKKLSARIAYVGSHSNHLVADLEVNPARPGSAALQARRLYPNGLSNITQADMGGNANYNSLQSTLQVRAARGLNVLLNYTWSKALDTLPLVSLGNNSDLNPSQSYVMPLYLPNYKQLDRGPSEFDRKHVLSMSYLYSFPVLHSGSRALRIVVNGWQTTGIIQAQSGDPLTIVAGSDISQTGLNQDRGVYNGSGAYGKSLCSTASCKSWLNSAAFSKPTATTFGNVQKGSFRGPNYMNWDVGAFRSFDLTHGAQAVFRAEYFDVLNHTNTADPVTSLSSGGFGTITSAGNYQPRIAQFSLKLLF